MEMSKEIQSLIERNLPAATASVLKTYLDEAERNKRKLQDYEAELKVAREMRDKFNELEHKEKELKIKEDYNKKLLEELTQRKNNFEVELIKKENQMLKDNKDIVIDLVRTVFRNKTLVYSTCENKNEPVPNGSYMTNSCNTKTTSVSEE